jgi:murein DD-endopeptidase MepM/ murein hydrolase activator NlpD
MANKKSAFQKAKHEHQKKYTFIITPNTSGRTFSFSISSFWLKNLAFFVGLFAVFAVLITVSYMGLLANYNMSKQDLVTLQSINKDQQVQLYEMNELSKEINDKLVYLNLLETEIKKMLDEDGNLQGLNDAINSLYASSDTQGSGSGNGAYMNYYVSSDDITTFDLSDDFDNMKETLSKLDLTMTEEQTVYEGLHSEVEAVNSYANAYPDFFPLDPNSGWVISDYFGYRTSPRVEFHSGLDLAAPYGTAVYAAAAGTVKICYWYGEYGYCITIEHGYGYTTLYGHLSQILDTAGQKVEKGELIGRVGSTGFSTGNHLHFEVWYNNVKENPLNYISIE